MKVSTLLILISLITIATLTNAQVSLSELGCPCDATIDDRGEFMRCVNSKTKELKQTYDKRAYKRIRKQYKKQAAKCEFGKEETSEDGGDQTTLDSGDGDSDDGEKKDCTTITKVNQCNKVGGGICSWDGISGTCIDKPGGTSVNGGGQGGNVGGGGNMNDGGGSNNSKPNGQGGNNMGNKPIKPKENGDSNPMNADDGESKPNMNNVGGNGNNNGQSGGKPMITGGTNEGGGGSKVKPNKPINGGGNTKPNGGRPPWAGQGDSEDGEDTETTEDSEDTETSADGVSSGVDGDGGQQKDCTLITKSNQCTNKWGGVCSWISGVCVGSTVAVSKQSSLQEADGKIPQPFNSSIKVKGKFSSLIFYAAAMLFYQA